MSLPTSHLLERARKKVDDDGYVYNMLLYSTYRRDSCSLLPVQTDEGVSYRDTVSLPPLPMGSQAEGLTPKSICHRDSCSLPPVQTDERISPGGTSYRDTVSLTPLPMGSQAEGLTPESICRRDSCSLPPVQTDEGVSPGGTSYRDTVSLPPLPMGSQAEGLTPESICCRDSCSLPPVQTDDGISPEGTSYRDTVPLPPLQTNLQAKGFAPESTVNQDTHVNPLAPTNFQESALEDLILTYLNQDSHKAHCQHMQTISDEVAVNSCCSLSLQDYSRARSAVCTRMHIKPCPSCTPLQLQTKY